MHSKRSLIRVLARILYACGFVLLVAGLLLSATAATSASSPSPASLAGSNSNVFNAVEVPFTGIHNSLPMQEPTFDPSCNCIRTPTSPVSTQPSGSPSSLVFTQGCDCSCEAVTAVICNIGGNMKEAVDIQLYYNPNGNPADGEVVKRGPVGPLDSGKCLALNYTPTGSGNYAFHVRQEPGADGPRDVWSSACMVDGSCFQPPTPTETPFQPATSTATTIPTDTPVPTETGVPTDTAVPPTATFTSTAPAVEISVTPTDTGVPTQTSVPPTFTATSPVTPPTSTATVPPQPMPFNLSFICGYAGDDYMLWWVRNNTGQAAEYVWRVSGSDEQGGGTVEANGVAYFTTSVGQKTVRLFVGGTLMDSAESSGPCKENLTLAVVCTTEGQLFVARNPNNFNVDYSWTIDGQPGGRGMLPANGSVNLITVPQGSHRVELTWTDTRPGTHTVALTSSPELCINTATPTPSPTAPLVEISLTPTPTNTQQVSPPTLTPTSTNTQPVVTVTPSPTSTATQPGVTPPTATSTATQTATSPVIIITTTPIPATPTATSTAPFTVITATPSFTPTRTSTAPFVIVTATPSATSPITVITTTPVPPTPTFITPATNTSVPTLTPQIIVVTPVPSNTPQVVVPTLTPQIIVVTPVPSNTPQVVVPAPTNTPQIIVVTSIPVTGPTSTATQLVTLAPPVVIITTTPALIPETGADLLGPGALISLGSLGGLFTNMGLFMLGTALALTGIRSLLSR